MEKRKLGSLEVPVIGLGTARTFDVDAKSDVSVRRTIVDNCTAAGSIFLDTSPMYGHSESVIGQVTDGRRDQFQFATKVWCRGDATGRNQISQSFDLLRTDYIEVLQIHNLLDWRTHLPYLECLKTEGRIGQIGITHYATSSYGEMASIMRTGRVDTIQIPYNVMERKCESVILPLADEMGIGVIVMEPLGVGRLTRGLKRTPDLAPLAGHGVETWAQALMAWILADPRVTTLIPATSQPHRVFENAKAGSMPPLTPDLREHISREAARCL